MFQTYCGILYAFRGRQKIGLGQFLRMLGCTALLGFILTLAAPSAQAEPTPGWKAFTSGEHKKAESIWRPLAEHGDRNAAFGMGVLAQARNQQEEAARWYEQAARAGLTSAQVLLGSMYIDGRGVPRNAMRAFAWLNRATLDGHSNAALARDAVGATLNAAELVEGKALSLTFTKP